MPGANKFLIYSQKRCEFQTFLPVFDGFVYFFWSPFLFFFQSGLLCCIIYTLILVILFDMFHVYLHGSEVKRCEAAVVTIVSGNINTNKNKWKKIVLWKKMPQKVGMVLTLDGKPDHNAHAWRRKNPICNCSLSNKMP